MGLAAEEHPDLGQRGRGNAGGRRVAGPLAVLDLGHVVAVAARGLALGVRDGPGEHNIRICYNNDIINCDISEYNTVLDNNDNIWIIDWPGEPVTREHLNANDLIKRDVFNIVKFFNRRFGTTKVLEEDFGGSNYSADYLSNVKTISIFPM